jgi:hypothetical protein
MEFAQQVDGQGPSRRERCIAEAQGATVVEHLEVFGPVGLDDVGRIVDERLLQRRLGAFDPAREHRLSGLEGSQEQLGAGQRPQAFGQATEARAHLPDPTHDAGRQRQSARQRRRQERPPPRFDRNPLSNAGPHARDRELEAPKWTIFGHPRGSEAPNSPPDRRWGAQARSTARAHGTPGAGDGSI